MYNFYQTRWQTVPDVGVLPAPPKTAPAGASRRVHLASGGSARMALRTTSPRRGTAPAPQRQLRRPVTQQTSRLAATQRPDPRQDTWGARRPHTARELGSTAKPPAEFRSLSTFFSSNTDLNHGPRPARRFDRRLGCSPSPQEEVGRVNALEGPFTDPRIPIGSLVQLDGLVANAHHNGAHGHVKGYAEEGTPQAGRYVVKLSTGESLQLKPSNVVLLAYAHEAWKFKSKQAIQRLATPSPERISPEVLSPGRQSPERAGRTEPLIGQGLKDLQAQLSEDTSHASVDALPRVVPVVVGPPAEAEPKPSADPPPEQPIPKPEEDPQPEPEPEPAAPEPQPDAEGSGGSVAQQASNKIRVWMQALGEVVSAGADDAGRLQIVTEMIDAELAKIEGLQQPAAPCPVCAANGDEGEKLRKLREELRSMRKAHAANLAIRDRIAKDTRDQLCAELSALKKENAKLKEDGDRTAKRLRRTQRRLNRILDRGERLAGQLHSLQGATTGPAAAAMEGLAASAHDLCAETGLHVEPSGVLHPDGENRGRIERVSMARSSRTTTAIDSAEKVIRSLLSQDDLLASALSAARQKEADLAAEVESLRKKLESASGDDAEELKRMIAETQSTLDALRASLLTLSASSESDSDAGTSLALADAAATHSSDALMSLLRRIASCDAPLDAVEKGEEVDAEHLMALIHTLAQEARGVLTSMECAKQLSSAVVEAHEPPEPEEGEKEEELSESKKELLLQLLTHGQQLPGHEQVRSFATKLLVSTMRSRKHEEHKHVAELKQQLIRERLGKMIDTVHEKPLVTVKEADVMHKLDLKRWQKKHWHDVSRLAAQAREYDARIHALEDTVLAEREQRHGLTKQLAEAKAAREAAEERLQAHQTVIHKAQKERQKLQHELETLAHAHADPDAPARSAADTLALRMLATAEREMYRRQKEHQGLVQEHQQATQASMAEALQRQQKQQEQLEQQLDQQREQARAELEAASAAAAKELERLQTDHKAAKAKVSPCRLCCSLPCM